MKVSLSLISGERKKVCVASLDVYCHSAKHHSYLTKAMAEEHDNEGNS